MTLVNADTGEVVELDAAAAERRAERIALRLDAIADNQQAVLPMISEAIEKRDHLALGYRSVGDYVADRFGRSLAGLGIEVRRAVVRELTEAGLSSRAIAPVVGVSDRQVRNDQQAGGKDFPPETDACDGSEPDLDDPPAKPITGIDGKNYPRSKPKPKPEPVSDEEADQINSAVNRATDPLVAYRANVSKALNRANDLTSLDVSKAVESAGESAVGHRQIVAAVKKWCDDYLAASRPDHLRSVQ